MPKLVCLALLGVVHATSAAQRAPERWLNRMLSGRTTVEFPGRTLDHDPCSFTIQNDNSGLSLGVDGVILKRAEASVEIVRSSYVFESGKKVVIVRLDEDEDPVVASAQEENRAVSCVLFPR